MVGKRKRITVIGLATFGEELARQLEAAGAEVTALDMDAAVIQAIRDDVSHAGVVDGRDIEALREFAVELSDLVVIGIRSHLEMSILIILALQDLGTKHIVALATGIDEVRAMKRMGVDRVIFPELDIARREAQLILNPSLTEYIELAEGYSIVEIAPPAEFVGRTIKGLGVRMHFGVNIVAIRNHATQPSRPFVPIPDYEIKADDHLLIIGSEDRIRELTEKST
jgi:trk system potassium uptake protein TrkA